MSPAAAIDYKQLAQTIAIGVNDGVISAQKPFLETFKESVESRHALRNFVQDISEKTNEIDGELRLCKGTLQSLVGATADGSSGLIPRMEASQKALEREVSRVSSEVAMLRSQVEEVLSALKTIRESQKQTTSFMDGWKGVAIALGILGTCVSVIGGIATALFWLFSHTSGVVK